jgi:hypothetical protein
MPDGLGPGSRFFPPNYYRRPCESSKNKTEHYRSGDRRGHGNMAKTNQTCAGRPTSLAPGNASLEPRDSSDIRAQKWPPRCPRGAVSGRPVIDSPWPLPRWAQDFQRVARPVTGGFSRISPSLESHQRSPNDPDRSASGQSFDNAGPSKPTSDGGPSNARAMSASVSL